MRTRISTSSLTLTLGLMLAATLTACGSGDDSVASLSTPSESPSAASSKADLAGDYAACLTRNGVVAEADANGAISYPELQSEGANTFDATENEDGSIGMVINGTDISEPMALCQKEVPDFDPFALTAADSNETNDDAVEWVSCIRDAGFPEWADPTQGVVVVPETLTPEDAAVIAEACPMTGLNISMTLAAEPTEALKSAMETLPGGSASVPGSE